MLPISLDFYITKLTFYMAYVPMEEFLILIL